MKKIILKAANLIANGKEDFSCMALDSASTSYRLTEEKTNELFDLYATFYGKDLNNAWFHFEDLKARDKRVLLLLTFAELQG